MRLMPLIIDLYERDGFGVYLKKLGWGKVAAKESGLSGVEKLLMLILEMEKYETCRLIKYCRMSPACNFSV